MTDGLFRKTIATGAQVAQMGFEAARVKDKVERMATRRDPCRQAEGQTRSICRGSG
jgi:hypothetical protein